MFAELKNKNTENLHTKLNHNTSRLVMRVPGSFWITKFSLTRQQQASALRRVSGKYSNNFKYSQT